MITTTSPPATRLCTVCGADQPLSCFRRVRKGSPDLRRECNDCHLDRCRQYNEKKRRKQMGRDLTSVKNARNVSELLVVINGMLKRWGGVPGLVETWNRFRESAEPNSSYQVKSVMAMLNMSIRYAEMQDRQGAKLQSQLNDMTDEQLERLIRDNLTKLMAEQPELAAMELRGKGWTVVAPRQSVDDTSTC